MPPPRPVPPAEVRRRLPPRALAAWLWAALRDRIPQLPASSGPVTRSRRLADLVRALRKTGLREHDPRVAALIASDPAGPPAGAPPDVKLLAALVAQDEARAEQWLRQAHAELRRAAPRLEPHPRDHTFLHGLHALALGGLLFDDPAALAWRKSALPRYWDELQHQVLDDGTLRERCPALLGSALRDALAAHALWRAAGFVAPNEVHRRLRRMARAFGRLARPGPGTHRFGDGAPLDGAATAAILELACTGLGEDVLPPAGPWALPAGGFYGFTTPGDGVRLAVTTGRMALADLPSGEHADALSFELDLGGRPLVVDPGTAAGAPVGPALRGWARSTWAHNTVVVDGTDQMPILAGGWTGETAEVTDVDARPAEGAFELSASVHHVGGSVHRRRLSCGADGLDVVDRVEGANGRRVATLVHFAPEVRLQAVARSLEARLGHQVLELTPIGATRLDVVIAERRRPCQGWVLDPARGAVPAPVVILEQPTYDGREIGYTLRWRG